MDKIMYKPLLDKYACCNSFVNLNDNSYTKILKSNNIWGYMNNGRSLYTIFYFVYQNYLIVTYYVNELKPDNNHILSQPVYIKSYNPQLNIFENLYNGNINCKNNTILNIFYDKLYNYLQKNKRYI